MSTAASSDPRIRSVRVTADEIIAHLADGRVIRVPLAWSWRLSEATPAQRAKFRLIGNGQGVHWPEIDEDISAEGMLQGIPATRPRQALQRTADKPRRLAKPRQSRRDLGVRPG
jgi:Protein of unknown function (DUF2442)